MEYYKSGQLFKSKIVKNGKLKEFATYYKTGEINALYIYNKIESRGTENCKNEKRMKKPATELNQKINGQVKVFYKNGTIMTTGEYKNGYQFGIWKEYNINGQLVKTDTLK